MLKNILSNWSNMLVSMLAVFLLYPFFIRILGEEQYGVWLLISSATGYFSLLQLGVPLANVRFISKYHAQGNYDKASQVLSTNLMFFSIVALAILIIGTGLAFILDRLFTIPKELIYMARLATIIATIDVFFRFIFEAFEGIFHAMQNFILFNIVKNLFVMIRILLTLCLLKYRNGLLILSSILLSLTIAQSLCFFFYFKLKYNFLKVGVQYIKKETFYEVIGYSFLVLLFNLATRISFQTDALVLGSVVSVSAIVWFNIGNNLLLYLTQVVNGISIVLIPRISQLDAKEHAINIKEIYLNYSRLLMFFVIPICLSSWFYGGDLIALWIGEQYRIVSGNTLSILTLGYLLFLIQSGVAFPIFLGTSKMKLPTLFMCTSAIVNLGLSLWWGRIYGIYGVAWGTTVPTLLFTILIIVYTCRTYSIDLYSYLFHSMFRPALASFLYLAAYLSVSRVIIINSFFDLFLCLTVCISVYSLGVYWGFMNSENKKVLSRMIFRRAV